MRKNQTSTIWLMLAPERRSCCTSPTCSAVNPTFTSFIIADSFPFISITLQLCNKAPNWT